MGSSASIVNLRDVFRKVENPPTMTLEELDHFNQLCEDLIFNHEIRLAFACYVCDNGVCNEIVHQLILKMDETYMCHIVIQSLWEECRDCYADIILHYMDCFSKSMVYDHYYRMSLRVEGTPPLTRICSVDQLV